MVFYSLYQKVAFLSTLSSYLSGIGHKVPQDIFDGVASHEISTGIASKISWLGSYAFEDVLVLATRQDRVHSTLPLSSSLLKTGFRAGW
jgi:hypothetical protein